LTELLTGLDLLPYRKTIFSGNSQQVAQVVVELNELLKADLPFVIRNARIRLLLAMAYHVLDQPILSYKSLLDALEQFKSTQTHRIILDEHPLILVLLNKFYQYQGNEVAVSSDIQKYIVSILEIGGRDFYEEGSFLLKDKQSRIESAMQLSSDNHSDPNIRIVLSEREIEILLLVERGLSDGQIADKIFLSIHTVKWHLRNIYHKLQVRSRTQAVAQAHQQYILK
jgi:ATP/maltotriose-dependent transcriptional regulator MalT